MICDLVILTCIQYFLLLSHNYDLELIEEFLDWCQLNHLLLNAGKTRELVVDFRRHSQPCTQVNIQRMDI